MRYIVSNIKLPLRLSEDDLTDAIARKIGLSPKSFSYEIYRRSIDARREEGNFVYRAIVDTQKEIAGKDIAAYLPIEPVLIPSKKLGYRPIVIGLGPSGLLASLVLARSGNKPIILERGKNVDDRAYDIGLLKTKGILNPESNVCYGEGGAGTFSDGKLHTGVKSPYIRFVLEEFVKHGAPKDILIDANPHIGSDLLPGVMRSFRDELLSLGADILFSSKFVDIEEKNNGLEIYYEDEMHSRHSLFTEACLLAYGHSPFDTALMLERKGLKFIPKDFSIGLRIEFPQESIDRANYHEFYGKAALPPSSFKSVTHLRNGRSVYSFCMCPGGEVVNSSSEEGTIVTNGMSKRARDLTNGNAAILVNLKVDDYFKGDPLDGYRYREYYEAKAYRKDKPYFAPASRLGDFLRDIRSESFGVLSPSYKPGVYFSSFDECLPPFAIDSLREGIENLRKTQSFYRFNDAILTGIETRSSSPARIPRDENGMSSIRGLYPIGEGASYAGGITTSAADGVAIALKILGK